MAEEKAKKARKVKKVQVKESDLVNLMDKIVNEAVKVEKTKWLNEQKEAENKKNSLLESKLDALTQRLEKLEG